jgi:hypothetical protein
VPQFEDGEIVGDNGPIDPEKTVADVRQVCMELLSNRDFGLAMFYSHVLLRLRLLMECLLGSSGSP